MTDDTQDQENGQQPDTHKMQSDASLGSSSRELPKQQQNEDPADDNPDVKVTVNMAEGKEADKADKKQLVIFDFDGTLTTHDSLKLMMFSIAGSKLQAYTQLALSFITPFIESIMTRDDYMDYKTAIKSHWIRRLLRGKSVDEVQHIAQNIKPHLGWRKSVVDDMRQYAEKGAEIVVATGALDVYIDTLLQGLPVKAVICTMLEIDGGRLTGELKGVKRNANPVRDEKRVRMLSYINRNGPYDHIVGYGNMPDDGPMLSLCDQFHVI